MNKLLLLPSAKLVPLELQVEFGKISSAMVPLDGRPALCHIAEPYVEEGFRVAVTVHEGAEQVVAYIARHPELRAQAIDVGSTASLGETVLKGLEGVDALPGTLVVNFADTYVGDAIRHGNVICIREQEDVYRWTTFRVANASVLVDLVEKDCEKRGDGLSVFVGVFVIDDTKLFHAQLVRAVRHESPEELDPFYVAVREYYNNLDESRKTLQKVADWRDFGHLDTYHATKKTYWLNQRIFNQVSVDSRRGIIRKSSVNVEDFTHEIEWYLKLPKKLQHLAPRVLDYAVNGSNSYVEMEFYGYPALADMYLFGDCNIGLWSQILDAVDHTVDEMTAFHPSSSDPQDLLVSMRMMYEEKTYRRLESVLGDDQFRGLCGREVRINGKTCMGVQAVLSSLPDLLQAARLYEQHQVSVIHGDLCLSNILYDRRNSLVRLVDPRGRFGLFDVYGDPRYDLAKLSHSLEGDYDFILNGMFESQWVGDECTYAIHLDQKHGRIKDLFRRRMKRKYGDQCLQIKLIESLLFLSMVPLHADRPRSQFVFLARGLELFDEVASSMTNAGGRVPA